MLNQPKKLPLIPLLGGLAVVAALGAGAYFFLNRASAGPVELTYGCVGNPQTQATCNKLIADFSAQTGILARVISMPDNSSLALSIIQEATLTRAPLDVFEIDVVWPGILANDVLDLKPYFSDADLEDFFPSLIKNNTIGNKLLAIPARTDTGVLFYRRDLLTKYGFANPPQTWDELTAMATKIQAGERTAGKKDFWGYVWQGAQYEGLTCNAMEWLGSFGAGNVVEADGTVSINNPRAVAALEMARGWVGTISPKNSTGLREETSRAIWQEGRAAFMRNWPYAYTLGNAPDSKIKGLFESAPLPKGPGGKAAATLGGWQLAVNKYSRFPKEAAELVKFMSGRESQKYRATANGDNPTRRSLYKDAQVLATNPFWKTFSKVLEGAVSRPSGVTAAKYDVISTSFYNTVNSLLSGNVEPSKALVNLQASLSGIKGAGW
jgi:trehalose/maltose transport system substrate-binding protein